MGVGVGVGLAVGVEVGVGVGARVDVAAGVEVGRVVGAAVAGVVVGVGTAGASCVEAVATRTRSYRYVIGTLVVDAPTPKRSPSQPGPASSLDVSVTALVHFSGSAEPARQIRSLIEIGFVPATRTRIARNDPG